MATLAEYQAEVSAQDEALIASLSGGTASAYAIAVERIAHAGMEAELQKQPQEVINRWNFKGRREAMPGPMLWRFDWRKRADTELHPFIPTEVAILRKSAEYGDAWSKELDKLNVKTHTTGHCDINYFVEDNSLVRNVRDAFQQAVGDWMETQRYERTFYQQSAIVGLATVLEQRQDIVIALRAAQDLGAGGVTAFPIDVPIWKEALAFGVSLVPYVGNSIALAEAYEGRDLFCRKLGTIERVLTVTLVAIPAVMKVAKAGRAVYTAARLSRLYGGNAASWSRVILAGERATAQPTVTHAVLQAGARVKAQQSLDRQITEEAQRALAILTGKSAAESAAATTSSAPLRLIEALKQLGAAKPALAELDHLALHRVVEAARTKSGPNLALAKGQLLEELKESRTVRLLSQQFAGRALGVEGKGTLEYFPGHMLTDAHRAKVTDGIVGLRLPKSQIKPQWLGQRTPQQIERIQGVIQPLAVDEAKAGRASAQGLGFKYDVTEADRAAIKAVAAKRFKKLETVAAKNGTPVGTTLEKVEHQVANEYKLGEIGGQARGTIERLDQFEDGSLPSIFFGDQEFLVYVPGVSKVKIFGVLPRDVRAAGLTKRLRGEGINFEVLGIDITAKELETLAAEVLALAK